MKPALTAEEWGWTLATREANERMMERKMYPEDMPTDIAGTPHAIAALALYGQSFGFTREDFTHLRICSLVPNGRLASIADRIEALLPPNA